MAATTPAPIGLEPGPAKFFPIEVVDEKVGGGVETDQKMGHPGIHNRAIVSDVKQTRQNFDPLPLCQSLREDS